MAAMAGLRHRPKTPSGTLSQVQAHTREADVTLSPSIMSPWVQGWLRVARDNGAPGRGLAWRRPGNASNNCPQKAPQPPGLSSALLPLPGSWAQQSGAEILLQHLQHHKESKDSPLFSLNPSNTLPWGPKAALLYARLLCAHIRPWPESMKTH